MQRVGVSRALGLLLALGLLATLVWARPQEKPASAAEQKKNAPQNPPASASAPSEYLGAEVCKTCHEDIYNAWEKSPHWKTTLDTKGGPSHQGCESCHGPGSAHVAGGGDVTKIFVFKDHSTKEIDARCLTCHAGATEHMNAINSLHSKNDVSCVSCHSPHHAETKEFLLVKAQPQLCYSCHLAKKAEFDMPFHHRVNEGLIQCTDCHNPHGTVRPHQVRSSSTQDAVCFTCHTDKQGPFVFEHQPVKVDGCQSCHLVHGGPNPHMLKLSNVNLLCLQCHTTSSFSGAPGAPSFHNQASLFQSCVLCHSAIHGSNFDPTFFK
ncbi:MAG TPA: DmsE family decaheme c-type cytochrome [Candidatus Acidoferrum sp.]|nr:DmsE family decaheme c-type cytochrome [Candidatus Acidoferrum sp.]